MSSTTTAKGVRVVDGIEVPAAGTWAFDKAHTHIGFVARHLMVTKVRGAFHAYDGFVHIGEGLEDSRLEVTIDPASVDTGQDMRDNHLKSADFFDVEKYPVLRFVGTNAERSGQRTFKLTGDLTVGSVTRPVTLDVEYDGIAADHNGVPHAGFSASTEINRQDWGITWNVATEAGGFLVGPKVKIEIEVELVPAEA